MVVVNSILLSSSHIWNQNVHRMWAFFFQKALIFLYGRQRAPHKTLLIAIFLNLGKK